MRDAYTEMSNFMSFLGENIPKISGTESNKTAIYNIIRRSGMDSLEKFKNTDLEFFKKRRHCGPVRLSMIAELQEIAVNLNEEESICFVTDDDCDGDYIVHNLTTPGDATVTISYFRGETLKELIDWLMSLDVRKDYEIELGVSQLGAVIDKENGRIILDDRDWIEEHLY